jgi:uncharacterized repeat protein (TIGR03843 family)
MHSRPNEESGAEAQSTTLIAGRALQLLSTGNMQLIGLMPDSSNYTFLAEVNGGELHRLAIYKPRRGERPLWDFPRGTLCQREVAAYLVSEALGWSVVPPTVLRNGPEYGVGSVQLFIDTDPEVHYFMLRGTDHVALKRIATFDLVINNADRKGGHVLRDHGGHLWGIDHGIAFHAEPKLRTVIWDYVGQPIPDELLADMQQLRRTLDIPGDPLTTELAGLLQRAEMDALRRRIDRLLRRPVFPEPTGNRSVPWPPI